MTIVTGWFAMLHALSARCRRAENLRGAALVVAILVVLAGVLDVVSTNASLAAGNLELNPLIAAIQLHWGDWWFAPKIAVHLVLAALVLWLPSKTMIRNASVVVTFYTVIIASNFHLADWTI